MFIQLLYTKIRKITVFIVLLFLISVNLPEVNAQRYSIDKEHKARKARKPFSFKYLFKKDASKAAARQVRKNDRRKSKALLSEQKANHKYQKKANNNKEKGQDRKVYTRMRKYEKQAERRRKNKPTKNFFERLFTPKKKIKVTS